MVVRDAVPEDLPAIAKLVGSSVAAVRAMWLDRTVRVAATDADELRGMVAFDASETAVEITRLTGDPGAFDALLAEPVAFAGTVSLPIEMVVPATDRAVREALESAGFVEIADGPRFEGRATCRYWCDSPDTAGA